MRTNLSIILLSIIVLSTQLSCSTIPIKDITIWSFIGEGADPSRPKMAALGSHSNFVQREYMTLDEWVNFLAATSERGPAICLSASDFTKQKTAVDQACKKLNCSYEQKKIIENIANHAVMVESLRTNRGKK